MIDVEWLRKVSVAYQVYAETTGPNYDIEQFIIWLYEQYGIVPQISKE